MITKKEDLYGTYVLNDNSGAIELYVDFINSFGIGNKIMEVEKSALALEVCRRGDRWAALWIVHSLTALDSESVKLTLSDLKPRTKVEYEKVTESIFDLKDEFESGNLFFKADTDGEYHRVDAIKVLGLNFDKSNLYRKVERPVEWWEDAVEFVKENACNMNAIARNLASGGLYVEAKMTRDKWCDFARILLEQEGE